MIWRLFQHLFRRKKIAHNVVNASYAKCTRKEISRKDNEFFGSVTSQKQNRASKKHAIEMAWGMIRQPTDLQWAKRNGSIAGICARNKKKAHAGWIRAASGKIAIQPTASEAKPRMVKTVTPLLAN
jgi:hypothetical protein